jgi:translation initiation factor 2A
MMRAERDAETSGAPPLKAAAAAASIANTRVIPGMAPPPDTSAANKNKARKERAKKKKEEEAEARAQLEALNESVAGLTTAAGSGDGAAAPAPAAGAAEAEGAVDPEKLLKKKLKLAKQIDELKSKAAGGMKLNSDQTAKIATEAALRAEIAELQSS